MVDAEALVTCESSMAVIIDVIEDEIESHEATEMATKPLIATTKPRR